MIERLAAMEFQQLMMFSVPADLRSEMSKVNFGWEALEYDAETGTVDIDVSLRQLISEEQYVIIDGERVSTDILRCDVIDDARHILSEDSDHAQRDNGKGFDKADTNKIRLILGQIATIGLHPQDILTLAEMSHKYRDQLAEIYAYYNGITTARALAIRKARLADGDLEESVRIIMLTDAQADPASSTHVYFDPTFNAIAVNVKGGDARILAEWRNRFIEKEPFRSFYARAPRFVKNRTRMIHGESVNRQSLLFPAHPSVAKWVIRIAEETYRPVVVNDEIRVLARRAHSGAVPPKMPSR
jgi:hypothetical protein